MGSTSGKIVAGAVLVAALAAGYGVMSNLGMFAKMPEVSYLTENEAAQRPVYSMLDKKEQAVYEALYRGITIKKEYIPLPYEIDGDTYSKIYCIFEKQEGRFFYLGSSYYTAQKVRQAQIAYRDDIDKADEMTDEFTNAELAAIDEIAGQDSEYEKVRAINDYIVKNCVYVTGEDIEYSATAYGCLVEKRANCEGYAKAFSVLAADFGLESILVTGKTDKGENHAWNQVKVDGEWYNIDVTWADNDNGDEVRHAYFLCSDKDFSETHIRSTENFTPFECTCEDNNYYVKNKLYVDEEADARYIIKKAVEKGQKSIEMKFSCQSLYKDFKSKYIRDQEIFDLLTESGMDFVSTMTVSVREGEGNNCVVLEIG